MRLDGKIALVTGAAKGIGASIARLFADEGAMVIVTDIDDVAGSALSASLPREALYQHLDVCEEENWKSVCQLISERYQHLDILVNNAGITGLEGEGAQNPEEASLSDWHRVHRVNLDGVFLGCKYGIALMKARGGAIINMSSRSGMVGIPRAAAYASSKAAVRNHTKTVALYCCEEGYPIRCNSVCPAAILTPLWDSMLGQGPHRQEAIRAIEAGIPMHVMGQPIDVAYACLYLASDESKYMTGAEICLDGGILAGSTASIKKGN